MPLPLTSLVIPSAGLFRHNERLWAALGAAKAAFPFEVVIPCFDEPSPRLSTRLAQLAIPHRFVVVGENENRIGELFHAGTNVAIGDVVVWLHDDALPVGEVRAFLRELGRFEPGQGVRVPKVKGSRNSDQAEGPSGPHSTRFIDRACIAFPRSIYYGLGIDVRGYAIDGYQVAVQSHVAREGFTTVVAACSITHEGGATLVALPARNYAELYSADTHKVSGILGTYVEHGQRPAVPRIIPKGVTRDIDFYFEDSGFDDAEEAVNSLDQLYFRYRGEKFTRITKGDRFTIAPLLDVYDVALIQNMGIGDMMMHSSAAYHFKRLFPHVRFRCFCSPGIAYVANRLPGAWDEVIPLTVGETFPQSARVWNVVNGLEGTPLFGFRQLGIGDIPHEERRMAPYVRKSIEFPVLPGGPRRIGIQLNGGWRHKRYARPDDLGDAIADLGFTPIFFGTIDIPLSGRHARVQTPTLDDFAGCLLQLDGWIGFDSGASYIANSLGIPSLWLFASHNPGGLIEACGAAGRYRTIWPAKPSECAKRYGKSCRPGLGGAFFGWGQCGLKPTEGGAPCLDELDPLFLAQEVVNLAMEFTSL